MRISTEPGDPGYLGAGVYIPRVDIKLDSVAVLPGSCITADDRLGYVKVVSYNADGTIKTDGQYVAYEEKFGTVEIVLPPGTRLPSHGL